MEESTQKQQEQADDLTTEYANNTFFEGSVWDLKILFGEWSGRTNSVDWHTSITLPWAQAKLMSYFLELNIANHESQMGKIPFPASMIPPEPPPLPESLQNEPEAKAFREMVMARRQRFLDSLK
jgi:hypothetical protein